MRRAVCSKLFAAVHRKREGVGGEGVSAAQKSHGGGTGWWGTCSVICPKQPEFALQPELCVPSHRDLCDLTQEGSELLEICLKDFVRRIPCSIVT